MQQTNHLKPETKESLKKPLAVLVALLLLTSTLGCQSVKEKPTIVRKKKNEIWLVDGEQLVLYRVISDTKEQTLTIKNNPAMKKFMCIDKDEADYWIEEADRE